MVGVWIQPPGPSPLLLPWNPDGSRQCPGNRELRQARGTHVDVFRAVVPSVPGHGLRHAAFNFLVAGTTRAPALVGGPVGRVDVQASCVVGVQASCVVGRHKPADRGYRKDRCLRRERRVREGRPMPLSVIMRLAFSSKLRGLFRPQRKRVTEVPSRSSGQFMVWSHPLDEDAGEKALAESFNATTTYGCDFCHSEAFEDLAIVTSEVPPSIAFLILNRD